MNKKLEIGATEIPENPQFEIEKGIEIPKDMKTQWPFKHMKIGDSVKFDGGPLFRRAANAAYAYAHSKKKDGVRFSIKWFPDGAEDELKGMGRIWRVS